LPLPKARAVVTARTTAPLWPRDFPAKRKAFYYHPRHFGMQRGDVRNGARW